MKDSSKQRKVIILLGSLFILAGILCNEWVLAYLFSSDGMIALSRRIVIWIFDFVMIIIGITFIVRRETIDLRRLSYHLITLVFILFIVEIGLNAAFFIMHYGEETDVEDKRYLLPQFEGKPWARDMYKEVEELSGGYREFRGWAKNEYHGKYVNINADGVRKSWNPSDLDENTSKKIYVFGGSLTWGESARDDFTIPSFISKKLHEEGYKYSVYNYGEWAYSNTQSIIYLILLLRDGHRPDHVFFYGGTDILMAYQSGKLGTLSLSYLFRERETEISDIKHIWIGVSNLLSKYSIIYQQLIKINRELDPPDSKFQEVAHSYNDEELQKLSRDLIEYMEKSIDFVDNLSKAYGFKYIIFWPPSIFTEEKLLDAEVSAAIRLKDESMKKLYRYTRDYLKTKSYPHFYDISDSFRGRNKPYYVDFGHIIEDGNEVAASRIVSIFEKEYLFNESAKN